MVPASPPNCRPTGPCSRAGAVQTSSSVSGSGVRGRLPGQGHGKQELVKFCRHVCQRPRPERCSSQDAHDLRARRRPGPVSYRCAVTQQAEGCQGRQERCGTTTCGDATHGGCPACTASCLFCVAAARRTATGATPPRVCRRTSFRRTIRLPVALSAEITSGQFWNPSAAAHPGWAAVDGWCLRVVRAGRRVSALAGAGGVADEPDRKDGSPG